MPNISISKPSNVDRQLWRYMNVLKFVDLLQRSCLWFTRLDLFQDPYEGFLPTIITPMATGKDRIEFSQCQYDDWRKKGCANCWFMSDYESAAMWDIYGKNGGVAITSNVSCLEQSIDASFDPGRSGLHGNAVRYLDFETAKLHTVDTQGAIILAAELHSKRKSFEHEQEYRLTLSLEEGELALKVPGKSVPISLTTLIEKVYVSPTAEKWVLDVVKNVVEKYSLAAPVVQSDLYAPVVK